VSSIDGAVKSYDSGSIAAETVWESGSGKSRSSMNFSMRSLLEVERTLRAGLARTMESEKLVEDDSSTAADQSKGMQ
jgi:hypothetical protein